MEEHVHAVDAYREQLQPVLASKAEEFQILGYDNATIQEVWDCLKQKKWKRLKGELLLHRLVNDVLTLSTHDYMMYLTMQAYKEPLGSFEEYENK
ncbi:post-transcriptional regulator [Ectobacillus ponti]|uniref:Post-transcriptional regulator n=1 Tax=Ectobacillus ponti TaxID=2961894 RepID=A0AA41X1L2_9BACI|nr:post-transcriptional regulator [Ectobacillus ponti]MCP8967289.1 post-transcriptional regulator [Ectobacillus ponti]